MKANNVVPKILILISFVVFLSFGFFHLAKFETVDEHFWKYERIPQYWQAIRDGKWKKTYINDKPGVSVALISGIGLLLEPHPEDHRIRDGKVTKNNLLTVYDSKKTEKINLVLRLPLLIFNGLFLFFFFWIIRKITDSNWVAFFSVMLTALSPILIGISQIINPDSLLWVFFFSSMLSYIALLKMKERRFLILGAIFTGLSLLSKYSAMILFPFYIFILMAFYFIQYKEIIGKEKTINFFRRELFNLLLIFIGSLIVFSVLMPAVFVKLKYLYRGTVGFVGFQKIITPLIAFLGLIILDNLFSKGRVISFLGNFFHKHKRRILKLLFLLAFASFFLVLLNCWLDQKIIPFDKIQDTKYIYNKTKLLDVVGEGPAIVRMAKVFLLEAYPFVFSIHPAILFLFLSLLIFFILKGTKKYSFLIFSIISLILAYFTSLVFSDITSNIRYSIVIYPLFFFLLALMIEEFFTLFELKEGVKNYARTIITVVIFIFCFIALWNIKPFYFNYTNFLLPNKFSVADAWGYGEYEAAQYLNSLPEAEKLEIWSDRNGVCQFLKGSCITGYKIDLNKIKPDYFVVSRRGSMRYRFQWKYPELSRKSSSDYYRDGLGSGAEWEIFIGGKSKNFVKIIKSEE